MRWHSQFNDNPTDERAETACLNDITVSTGHDAKCWLLLTCCGETSGIMTKGMGPIPIANDAMNVITARLASGTAPLSSPIPTPIRDKMPPAADRVSKFFRPMRYHAY